MRAIMELVNKIEDELNDAREYAEKYVEHKAKEKNGRSSQNNSGTYHSMSEQELSHANLIHDIALSEIDELERVFVPTELMKKKWSESHANYVEKMAWIRQMLAM